MWEQKQFGNNWNVEKNLSVEPDPFLKKVDRKPVAFAKTLLTIQNESFSVQGFYQFFIEDF